MGTWGCIEGDGGRNASEHNKVRGPTGAALPVSDLRREKVIGDLHYTYTYTFSLGNESTLYRRHLLSTAMYPEGFG